MYFNEELLRRFIQQYYTSIGLYYKKIEDIGIQYMPDDHIYIIQGTVIGKYDKHQPQIILSQSKQIASYYCDCDDCSLDGGCAHIGAILRKVNSLHPVRFPFYWSRYGDEINTYEAMLEKMRQDDLKSTSNSFLSRKRNQLKNINQVEAKSINLMCIVEKTYADGFLMRFKIGEDKYYYIKNIGNFLDDVITEKYVSYGKEFATSHRHSDFSKQSLHLLQLMQEMHLVSSRYNVKNNEMFITKHVLDRFYDEMKTMPELINMDFEVVNLASSPIQLDVIKKKDYIEVSLNKDTRFVVGNRNLYRFILSEDGSKYICVRYDFKGNRNVIDLYDHLLEHPILVDTPDFKEFDRYIFNTVDQYYKLDSNMVERAVLDNRIEVHGDINDDGYAAFTIHAYRDLELMNDTFSIQDTSSTNYSICRNILSESGAIFSEDMKHALFNFDDKRTQSFLQYELEKMKGYADVFISESLKRFSNRSISPIRLGVSFSNNLLSVNLEHDLIPSAELKDVLKAYKRKKRFYRLKNGEMIALFDEDYQEAQDIIGRTGNRLEDLDEGRMIVNPYRVFMLDALAEQFGIQKADTFQKHLDALQIVNQSQFELPEGINATLRQYQLEGYQWLRMLDHYGFGGILADDMGLGKTLQMICYFMSKPVDKPHLVVCPSTVLLNWEQEFLKFAPKMKVCVLHGPKNIRDSLIEKIQDYDVVVTSYDYLRRDIEDLQAMTFDTIVLDEAQYIKNANTKNSKSVKQLQGRQRFALTGTPIENTLAELWSIFDFLMPAYLYNYKYFKQNFESPIVKQSDELASKQLKDMVQPFILRRLKKDVLTDLPDKMEIDMFIEFSEEERKLYYANLAQANAELQELANMEQTNEIQILALLTRLRRLCCEPRLVYENVKVRSSKLESTLSFIKDLKEDGKRILVFSSFTTLLDLLGDALVEEGISFHRIDGSVNKVERQKRIESFQSSEVDVFLISLRAGGTGINLTNAEVVIHFDPWWNISAQNQATDRAYRIGQTKNVLVYRFIMKDSIEEKIQKLQERKKQLSDAFVEEATGSVVNMSKDEILSLFTMEDIS